MHNSDMRPLVAAALTGLLLAGAAPASAAPDRSAAPATPEQSTAFSGAIVARYSFDGGSSTVRDESGLGHDLHPVYTAGGTLRSISRAGGRALQFPGSCAARKKTCPHAVLQSPSTAALNPGLDTLA